MKASELSASARRDELLVSLAVETAVHLRVHCHPLLGLSVVNLQHLRALQLSEAMAELALVLRPRCWYLTAGALSVAAKSVCPFQLLRLVWGCHPLVLVGDLLVDSLSLASEVPQLSAWAGQEVPRSHSWALLART